MMSVAAPVEATPPNSALKRTHSVAIEEASPSPTHSPVTKRPKVQFGDNQVRFYSTDDSKPLSLVKEEVRRALEQHRAGNSSLYDALAAEIVIKPKFKEAPTCVLLKRYMIAITAHSNLMDRRCTKLVDALLEMRWLGRDEEFTLLYRRLLINLVCSYGGYLQDIFSSLVDTFMTLRPHHGRLGNLPTVNRSTMLNRLHGTIKYLLSKLPSAQSTLRTVIQETFPYMRDSTKEHVDYVNNILRIANYTPSLRADIVSLIVDKVSSIDVQTQVGVLDLEDDLQSHLNQDLAAEVASLVRGDDGNDVVQADTLSDSDMESPEEEFKNPKQQRLHTLKLEVAKIDGIMDLLFAHFAPIFSTNYYDEQEKVFSQLIGMFMRTMLPTFKSRHIQFLLFHFSQTNEHHSERFIQALLDSIVDRNQPAMFRRSAAAYLGSFLARGAKLPRNLIQQTFYTLAEELDRLRGLHEQNEKCGPDLQRFGTYYSIFQALIYFFCFRWRDMLAEDYEETNFDVSELKWGRDVVNVYRRNIYSKLNPLKVCTPVIVEEFAKVAQQLEILMLEPKLQQNKRIRLTRSMFSVQNGFSIIAERENALTSKVGEESFQIEGFFPFDPYNLPLSKKWMEGEYNAWTPVPVAEFAVGDEESSEEDSDDEEAEEEEEQEVEEEEEDAQPTETDPVAFHRLIEC